MQYPNGLWVRHDYTARGQLQTLYNSWGGWNVPVEYHYLADGKLSYKNHASGIQTLISYDGRGFPEWVRNFFPSSGQEVTKRTYYRDERDRITSFQKGSNNPVNPMEDGRGDHYWYDAEGQLTNAYYGAVDPVNNPHDQVRIDSFPYDALGNRMGWNLLASRGWMNFTRKDNGLNQYRAWWNYSIINYDDDFGPPWGSAGNANGVMMQDGWITASYNALNQPKVIWSPNTPGGAFLWFGFDPLGRCVKRWYAQGDGSSPNSLTYFVYDGWNLLQEGASPWTPSRFYINGGRVDEIVQSYNAATGVLAYHYYDASGHCTLLSDWQGAIREQYYYDAFGYPYFYGAAGNWLGTSPHGNRFLFTGREWFEPLKLYDFRNRLYQPELGRFLQPDPKEFAAGDYNLYRYCHNDPVNKTDALGFDWRIDPRMDEKYTSRMQDQIDRARKSDPRVDQKFNAMEKNHNVMNTFTDAQTPENKRGAQLSDGTRGNSVEPRGKDAIIYFSPDNWRVLSGFRDPVIGVFHELPHIERVNNGTFSRYGAEGVKQEIEAIKFENIGRALIDGSTRSENIFDHDITYR